MIMESNRPIASGCVYPPNPVEAVRGSIAPSGVGVEVATPSHVPPAPRALAWRVTRWPPPIPAIRTWTACPPALGCRAAIGHRRRRLTAQPAVRDERRPAIPHPPPPRKKKPPPPPPPPHPPLKKTPPPPPHARPADARFVCIPQVVLPWSGTAPRGGRPRRGVARGCGQRGMSAHPRRATRPQPGDTARHAPAEARIFPRRPGASRSSLRVPVGVSVPAGLSPSPRSPCRNARVLAPGESTRDAPSGARSAETTSTRRCGHQCERHNPGSGTCRVAP